MRYLGIDYGSKRVGIAVSDDEGRMAFPKEIIRNTNTAGMIKRLKMVVREQNPGQIIVGLPIGMDGEETEQTRKVRGFAEALQKYIRIPVVFENEMFTTRMARPAVKKGKSVDASSAALILQSYLDKHH